MEGENSPQEKSLKDLRRRWLLPWFLVEAVEWGFAFAAFSVFILLPLHLINNDLESKNVAWFSDLLVACDILFGLQFLASFFYWDEPIEESQLQCMGFIFKSRIQ